MSGECRPEAAEWARPSLAPVFLPPPVAKPMPDVVYVAGVPIDTSSIDFVSEEARAEFAAWAYSDLDEDDARPLPIDLECEWQGCDCDDPACPDQGA